MGTQQTKNNSKQDTQQGKSEGKGKNTRRKGGSPQGAGSVLDSGREAKGSDGGATKK
ncbi:MAG: hypothetical protein ABI981_00035 [Betaproteobacteria bacterium]